MFLIPLALFGNPKGAEVISGDAHLNEAGSRLEVRVSDRAVIHWDQFSVLSGETTQFIQPGADSAVLNRVMGGVTHLDGLLQANGRVYLLNPHGVLIGKDGVINAAGFVASTLDLENEAFFKGQDLLFKGKSNARIVNLGKIQALGGDVFLLAKAILNEGTLEASEGVVGIAAASEILLKPSGEQRIFIAPKKGMEKEDGGIENKGLISAALAELRADGNAYRFAINQEGTIEANGIEEREGRIFLVADGGAAIHSGVIKSPSGKVQLLGDQVGLEGDALIDVSGKFGGGEVLVGGDYQGKNPEVINSSTTVIQPDARVIANATIKGDGGRVICWSDGLTYMAGTISVDAGENGGNGGFVEISGKENLGYFGLVHAYAPQGKRGQLLLDPSDIEIGAAAANIAINFNPTTGVYTPAGPVTILSSSIGVTESLYETLNTGSVDITVSTASSFTTSGQISLFNSFTWSTDNNLTLNATDTITFDGSGGPFTITSTGNGSLIANAATNIAITDVNLDFTGGNLVFQAGQTFQVNSQVIDTTINTVGGNLVVNAGSNVTIGNTPVSIAIGSQNGAVQMNVGGNLSVLAPTGAGKSVIVNAGGLPNTFNVGGNLLVQGGGSGANAIANIGGQGNRFANMTFKVLGNVSILGGSAPNSYAQVGFTKTNAVGAQAANGNVTFSFIGENLLVMGGTGSKSFAQIGHANSQPQTSFTASGNIVVNNVFGSITVTGSTAEAVIGMGNAFSNGGDAYSGTVTVNGRAGTTLNAGTGGAAIGFFGTDGASPVNVSGNVNFSDVALTLNGGGAGAFGNAFVGAYASNTSPLNGTLGLVNVDVRDNLVLNGGVSSGGLFNGTAAIGAFSNTGNVAGNVLVNAGNLTMNAPSTGYARILTSKEGVANGFQLNINANNMFIGTGGPGPSTVQILGGNNVTLIAENDVVIRQPAFISNASGNVVIVVDNANPSPPEMGSGRFILGVGSILESAGLMRIYTSQSTQNSIQAPINGVPFIPGAFFANSDTEQWASYFARDFGGVPFTIFYKTGISPNIFNEYGRVISEMFASLETYDELLFQCKSFLFGFDRLCYDQLSRPRGMVSSYDLFPITPNETMLRRKYRNTHTKFVEAF